MRRATRRRLKALYAAWRRLPLAASALLCVAVLTVADVAYQLARKPTELLGLVLPSSPKAPEVTWARYRDLFEEHATEAVRPELLAALVQVESAGDPLARTYWRWRWSLNPLDAYAPASSAVGILQITDGTFAEARRYCIHRHAVVADGPWWDPTSCWFNALYLRTSPGDAIEMTSAWLDLGVAEVLAAPRIPRATPAERDRLAAVIHLCGKERAAAFARRGFRPAPGERCGDEPVARYLSRVQRFEDAFARLAAGG